MNEKQNPFDDLFDQISQLLEFVKARQHMVVDDLPPDIDQRLERLRKQIDKFNRLSNEIVGLSGISDEELKMRLNGVSAEVPSEGKLLIERGRQIKEQVQDYNDQLERALKNMPEAEKALQAQVDQPEDKVVKDEDYAKKRRSKFKRLGSDQKWKPL
jgi:hypothetical protein